VIVIRSIIFLVVLLLGNLAINVWEDSASAVVNTHMAVGQVNGGDAEWIAMRTVRSHAKHVRVLGNLVMLVLAAAIFAPELKRLGQSFQCKR